MLDGSGSIGETNFVKAKSFVDKLVAAYTVQTLSRVGFITFSNDATTVVTLTNTLSPAAISATILSATFAAGATYTNLGIDKAIEEFNSTPRPVPLNMVVLTDGASTDHTATLTSAGIAAVLGIRSFAVGIGNSVNQPELIDIAGGNSSRVYNANNFDDLIALLNPLSIAICAT